MESNLGQQAPKLNVTNVSSAVFGKDGPALGKESKIGTLSRILRTTRIKVNNVEKVAAVSKDKISRIINILKTQQMTTGEKLPSPKKNEGIGNIGETLVETNRILVEIQNQLAYDFAMQVADQKKEEEDKKKERSREKLKAEESALEKGRRRIGDAIAKTTKKAVAPFKGIFDQIKEFVMTVGAGIAVNAAFDWLSKEENRKKMEDAFTFLKNNWKWIAGVAAGLFLMSPIIGIVSSIVSVGSILFAIGSFLFSILGAPVFLTLLGLLTAAGGIYALVELLKNRSAGGRGLRAAIEAQNKIVDDAGIGREIGFLKDEKGEQRFARQVLIKSGQYKGLYRLEKPGGEVGAMEMPIQLNTRNADNTGFIGTEDQFRIFNEYKKNIGRLTAEKNAMDAEIKAAYKEIITEKNIFQVATNAAQIADFDAKKAEIERKYNQQYIDKYGDPSFGGIFNNLPGKRGGGPVTAGKPYLVGESGPELFMPRIDGTIVDNTRTERIYQVLASGRRGRMRTITLPPQVIEGPKPEVEMPLGAATKEPKISSSNPMDGSRSMTSEIYGIMV